jgi:hypothetical protein
MQKKNFVLTAGAGLAAASLATLCLTGGWPAGADPTGPPTPWNLTNVGGKTTRGASNAMAHQVALADTTKIVPAAPPAVRPTVELRGVRTTTPLAPYQLNVMVTAPPGPAPAGKVYLFQVNLAALKLSAVPGNPVSINPPAVATTNLSALPKGNNYFFAFFYPTNRPGYIPAAGGVLTIPGTGP